MIHELIRAVDEDSPLETAFFDEDGEVLVDASGLVKREFWSELVGAAGMTNLGDEFG